MKDFNYKEIYKVVEALNMSENEEMVCVYIQDNFDFYTIAINKKLKQFVMVYKQVPNSNQDTYIGQLIFNDILVSVNKNRVFIKQLLLQLQEMGERL